MRKRGARAHEHGREHAMKNFLRRLQSFSRNIYLEIALR